jgi:hypothetical protein
MLKQIATIAKCDEATALRLHAIMAASDLDFSGCTKAEFRRAVLTAVSELKVLKWQKQAIG